MRHPWGLDYDPDLEGVRTLRHGASTPKITTGTTSGTGYGPPVLVKGSTGVTDCRGSPRGEVLYEIRLHSEEGKENTLLVDVTDQLPSRILSR